MNDQLVVQAQPVVARLFLLHRRRERQLDARADQSDLELVVRHELLKAARAAGCATVDGGTMAVGQAVGAFELFTGLQGDVVRMEQHFRRLLGQGQ